MRLKKRRGAALVEMAITVPVLITLLAGIIDIGWLYNHQLVLTNASREGARLGSLGLPENEVQDGVMNYLQTSGYSPMPPAENVSVVFAGDEAEVSIASTVPLLVGLFGQSYDLRAEAHMRVE